MNLSVCIATYNGARFLPEVFPSILTQLSEDDEVIVIDDASQDNTFELLQALNDARIKIVRNSKNVGAPESFFKALRFATNDVIVLADQDDKWLSQKASFIRTVFETSSVELLIHNAYIIENGRLLSQTLFEHKKSAAGGIKNFISNGFIGCCMAFRKSLIPIAIPYFTKFPVYHDQFIGMAATFSGAEIRFDPTCLIYFNRHSSNLSQLQRRRNIGLIFLERFCLFILLSLHTPKLLSFLFKNKNFARTKL